MALEQMSGFLVVEKEPDLLVDSVNAKYQGLYRTPPFDQDAFDRGFDDPYLTGRGLLESGLLATHEDAKKAFARLAVLHRPEDLEILFAREVERGHGEPPPHWVSLGFDIACKSPFWSILADLPPSADDDALRQDVLSSLNPYGLLDELSEARMYVASYIERHILKRPELQGVELFVWRLYRD